MTAIHEYIWLDDNAIRSKVRAAQSIASDLTIEQALPWDSPYFDVHKQQYQLMYLQPVAVYKHPLHSNKDSQVVLCETVGMNKEPMWFNHRAKLRHMLDFSSEHEGLSLGFEQEYVLDAESIDLSALRAMSKDKIRLFYHGSGLVKYRALVDEHFSLSLAIGLCVQGYNCESIPNQWEFQIGQGPGDLIHPLKVCDDKVIALWLLERLVERYEVSLTLDCKPLGLDFGGSGCHVNFALPMMREEGGYAYCQTEIVPKLQAAHAAHILVYGRGNEQRLSGQFTTCPIDQCWVGSETEFSSAIRMPPKLVNEGKGYLEDRRPAANSDAYLVAARLLATLSEADWPWAESLADSQGYRVA